MNARLVRAPSALGPVKLWLTVNPAADKNTVQPAEAEGQAAWISPVNGRDGA